MRPPILQLAEVLNPEPLIQASIFVISLAAFITHRWTPKKLPQFSWHSQIHKEIPAVLYPSSRYHLKVIWALVTAQTLHHLTAQPVYLLPWILNSASYRISGKAYWPWLPTFSSDIGFSSRQSQIALFLVVAHWEFTTLPDQSFKSSRAIAPYLSVCCLADARCSSCRSPEGILAPHLLASWIGTMGLNNQPMNIY